MKSTYRKELHKLTGLLDQAYQQSEVVRDCSESGSLPEDILNQVRGEIYEALFTLNRLDNTLSRNQADKEVKI